jgi:hypothetical protein
MLNSEQQPRNRTAIASSKPLHQDLENAQHLAENVH